MVKNYLIDTNIIIYLLENKHKIVMEIENLGDDVFSISTITRLEVLMDIKKHSLNLEQGENYLDDFENISFDKDICREAAKLNSKNVKKLKFKDIMIAATAQHNNLTLVTSDKDFLRFKNLKVKYIKV